MAGRFNPVIRGVLLASRWAMAPLCLGLVAALVVLIVQFGREFVHAVTAFAGMRDGEVIIAVLKLVDLVLVANLVIMIIEAGIEIFRPRIVEGDKAPPQAGSGTAEFAALKPKLFASISAIAAIDLLEGFVNIDSVDKTALLWEILMLLAFVISGVLLAWMERLGERH